MSDEIVKTLMYGGVSGAIARTCSAPFERLKILGQTKENIKYLKEVIRITNEDGFLAFWRGNYTNCLRITPNSAIQFYTYDMASKYVPNAFIGGGIAGGVSLLATYPLDYSRSILTVQQGKATIKLTTYIAQKIRAREILHLYRGLSFSLFATIPYNSLNFGLYTWILPKLLDNTNSSEFDIFASLRAGVFGGFITGGLTYPCDLVRRHMQLRGQTWQGTCNNIHVPNYKNALDCIKQIYTKYGITGFYKGYPACAIRTPIAVSTSLTSFEMLRTYFGAKK